MGGPADVRFLCWGDVGLDLYEGEPAPRPGGCALNVATSLAAEGAPGVAVAAPVGSDGAFLRDLLTARGVDATRVEVRTGATPRQRIRLSAEGERDLCGYAPGVLEGFTAGPGLRRDLAAAGLVHVPVFDHTRPWVEVVWALRPDAAAAPVALDLMDLGDVDAPFAEEAVARAAVVFAGLDRDRHAAWIERLAAWSAHPGAALVVVTLGAAGAVAFAGGEATTIGAAPVPGGRVVDTTGCGDAFAGAFLARRARGEGLRESLAAASRRAAAVAAHRGAVPLP